MLIEPYLALDEAQAESRRSSVTVPGEPLASLLYPAPATASTATGAAETGKERSNQVIVSWEGNVWQKNKKKSVDQL